MGLGGARDVVCTDISQIALTNIQENIEVFKLNSVVRAVCGDLFEAVSGKFDLISFIHPYFEGVGAVVLEKDGERTIYAYSVNEEFETVMIVKRERIGDE